jgi:pimeloyl-ACP methyl ester carboxylesterase
MQLPPRTHLLCVALAITGCVNTPLPPEQARDREAATCLQAAGNTALPAEQRAALYLNAAAMDRFHDSGHSASTLYNKAATDLTVLLRSADHGQLWNRPLTVTGGTTTYRLRFAKGTRDGIWDPAYFTAFTPAEMVHNPDIRRHNFQDGIGGALVGVHKTDPLEHFSPLVGVTAPVTAVLDFHSRDATLMLLDPGRKPRIRHAGTERPVTADFTAPLAFYPKKSEFWNGLMGAIRVDAHMKTTGLYMLQPYDPDRIPLIFVHGLISTARMWRNVINEIEADPTLRGRYQCLVFAYPTGNPPAYSALRLREEMDKFYQLHPDARRCVLVGHSMGGLLSRMQATTVTRASWDAVGRNKAALFFADIKKGSLVDRCCTFNANPHVARLIFICTPHRGSEMAVGSLGELAVRLISLPGDLTASVAGSLGNTLAMATGSPHRMPNSVTGLSPSNPMLKVLDGCPIQAPCHTIAGDRGKGDAPNSSDGVVHYWSSHLTNAKSECIVPGPHGSCELPQTIDELRRLLHLHLKETGGGR